MGKSPLAAELGVSTGALKHGLPYLALGAGRPLVFLRWFTPDHANPRGWMREAEIRMLAPLARHFRVYAVNRAPRMPEGTTMRDIAGQHAEALAAEFGGPVDVIGMSSGGSVGLQLAADYPAEVRKLVVVSSGYRLEEAARASQMRYARAAYEGRRALHLLSDALFSSPALSRVATAAMWLLDPLVRPLNPADTLAFARAEDDFDIGDRLGKIAAPTLVIGGERDAYYSTENFRRTADGIPDSRLTIYPDATHTGVLKHARFTSDVIEFLTH
ncbi:alpha/beta fold hydrolase [Nocardia arthritidis]|uniref:Alpha/beta fold hydrolase n=1 Tax=Nocardia arthritidis TaxID=228602 RepID=A0A6G9YSU0_9NOCA|nr:alpha/beta hydrolase [Nocardia arthritidis]QIS15953.1 alpha/beta fold hydrolase [Nocardia arthritidis]